MLADLASQESRKQAPRVDRNWTARRAARHAAIDFAGRAAKAECAVQVGFREAEHRVGQRDGGDHA
jgi:hypothetical protein